jgi:hypothetical protein
MQRYFDMAEQESIRKVLLLYAKTHGIGVPRLSWRIVADHPLKMELPVRTLARFLGGRRVNDGAGGVLWVRHQDNRSAIPVGRSAARGGGNRLVPAVLTR